MAANFRESFFVVILFPPHNSSMGSQAASKVVSPHPVLNSMHKWYQVTLAEKRALFANNRFLFVIVPDYYKSCLPSASSPLPGSLEKQNTWVYFILLHFSSHHIVASCSLRPECCVFQAVEGVDSKNNTVISHFLTWILNEGIKSPWTS